VKVTVKLVVDYDHDHLEEAWILRHRVEQSIGRGMLGDWVDEYSLDVSVQGYEAPKVDEYSLDVSVQGYEAPKEVRYELPYGVVIDVRRAPGREVIPGGIVDTNNTSARISESALGSGFDQLESMLMAMAGAGIDLGTDAMAEAIKSCVDGCINNDWLT